uniref:Kinetochore protein Spc24 n=1 Tax=Chelonoidis abingdonii TaxID=106734 RepID=A0A8C0GA66_CHEAB
MEEALRRAREDDGLTAAFHSYIAQLYYKISRIDWDYECEHPHIKGIHHGPAIAQPISLDSSQLSQCFVSDYLWSLVDTAW